MDGGKQEGNTRDGARSALLELLENIHHQLDLFLPTMAPSLFDQEEILAMLSSFARRHRDCRVRILVYDSQEAIRQGHRLIALIQRIPSKIQLKRVPDELQEYQENLVIGDERSLLLQADPNRSDWEYHPDNPLDARRYAKRFHKDWEQALPDRGTRVLSV